MDLRKKNLAVFASGTGTNFLAIQKKIVKKIIPARITLLITNKTDIKSIDIAKKYHIDHFVFSEKDYSNKEEYAQVLLKKLIEYKIDYIILAGYLKIIPRKIIQQFNKRIVNIHPALLPKFGGTGMYGIHVHEAAIQANEKESGLTVHFVDEKYDHGPIIIQKKVPVIKNDTPEKLQKRILTWEHKVYPYVVKLLCEDKIRLVNDKVVIDVKKMKYE